MFDKRLPVKLCHLSCFLLGVSASLVYSLGNFDIYILLRYVGLGFVEAQGVWYFFRRFNLIISAAAIVLILFFGSGNRKTVKNWSWVLALLYGYLLVRLYPNLNSRGRLTLEIQWILFAISIASAILQCFSVFYIFDPEAPGKQEQAPIRLALYILGYCGSGWLVRLFAYYNTPIDNVYMMGPEAILCLLLNIMLVYTALTFVSALTITSLIRYHWPQRCVEYLHLSIGGTVSFLVNYNDWKKVVDTALGWMMAPFCGLVVSFVIFKVAMTTNASMISFHNLIFCIYPFFVTALKSCYGVAMPESLNANLLKIILAENAQENDITYVNVNNLGKCQQEVKDKSRSIRARLLRDTQPWVLLPHGFWTSWCDYDAEDHKIILHCLGIHFQLVQIRRVIAKEECLGQLDCKDGSNNSLESQCAVFKEVECSLLWALSCYISRYEQVCKSIEAIVASKPNLKLSKCRFETLLCQVQTCIFCHPESPMYVCKNCVYQDSALVKSTMMVARGTLFFALEKAKELCASLGTLYDRKSRNSMEALHSATLKLESYLEELAYLMLVGRLMDEWLLICGMMQTLDRSLLEIIDKLCLTRREQHYHPLICDHTTTQNQTQEAKTPPHSNKASTTQCGAPPRNTRPSRPIPSIKDKCGCRLVNKLFDCALKLHRKQCKAAELILNDGCLELENAMPTLSHIRATVLIVTNYLMLTEHVSNPPHVCTTCKTSGKNCIDTCSRYNHQLDELLDELISGMDTLKQGDRILGIVISLISCATRNTLSQPIESPSKMATFGKKVSDLFFGAYSAFWQLQENISGKAEFTYQSQHCSCKNKNCTCCKNTMTGSTETTEKPCSQCLDPDHKNCCNSCKAAGGCQPPEPKKQTSGTCCSNDKNCSCCCPPDTCNIKPITDCKSCCTTPGQVSAPNCNDTTLLCIMKKLCCLTNGIGACWILWINSLCCNGKQQSVLKNLCSFKANIETLKECCKDAAAGGTTTTSCCKGNDKDECINKNAGLLLKALYTTSYENHKDSCKKQSSQATCPANCIGCSVTKCYDKTGSHTCSNDTCCMNPKDVCKNLKELSDSAKSIGESVKCICSTFECIKSRIACIGDMGHLIEEWGSSVYTAFYRLVDCAKAKAKELRRILDQVKAKQKSNIEKLETAIETLKTKLRAIQARFSAHESALQDQVKTMDQNKDLMNKVTAYTNQIHQQISKMTNFVNSTRRSMYMDSLRDTLFHIKLVDKHNRKEEVEEEWTQSSLIFYIFWIFWIIGEGTILEFLPYFGTITEYDVYKTLGVLLSLCGSYLLNTGFTSLTELTHDAGYLINVVILLGTAMTIGITWITQGYAYRSYMMDKFNHYYKGYRLVYPDYINPRWSSISWVYCGFTSLVLADLKGIYDFLYLKDIVYNSDPYNLGFSPRLNTFSPPKRNFMYQWTEPHALHYIKTGVLEEDIMEPDAFFDYLSFTMPPQGYFKFVVEDGAGEGPNCSVDLEWNAWSRGTKITKGHYEVYDARLDALNQVSEQILRAFKEAKIRKSDYEKKVHAFQKEQFKQMATRCLGLSFVPSTAKFFLQQKHMIDLFSEEYNLLWTQMQDDGAESTAEEITVEKSLTVYELSNRFASWRENKRKLCNQLYNRNPVCLEAVDSLSVNFEAFLKSRYSLDSYSAISSVYERYEEFTRGPDYVPFAMLSPYATDRPSTMPSLGTNHQSTLEKIYQIGHDIEYAKQLSEEENITFNRYLLGEWIKIQCVSISPATIKIIFQGPMD